MVKKHSTLYDTLNISFELRQTVALGVDPRANQGNMSGNTRGWIANVVKSWAVTMGISQGFIAFLKPLSWVTSSSERRNMSFYLSLHMYMTTERGLERNVSLEDWEFDSRSFNTRCPKEKLLRKCAQHSKLILAIHALLGYTLDITCKSTAPVPVRKKE